MNRFSRRWLQSWSRLALFAMLAILTSPALAFACCCADEAPATLLVATSAAHDHTSSAPQPSCHAPAATITHHSEAIGAHQASRADAVVSAISKSVVAPHHFSLKSLCECPQVADSTASFVETQNGSSFSPLIFSVAVSNFSPVFSAPSSHRFAFASHAARPRGPDLALRSGRAPPAFSLSC